MYRILMNNGQKVKVATFTAAEAMKKGMFVTKDIANGTVVLPTSATDEEVYIVDFNPVIEDLLSIEMHLSAYDSRLNDVSIGDFVSLEAPVFGEEYATDQFVATSIVKGSFLEVNTDGKLVYKATASRFVATDIAYNDAGHTLLAFTVVK